MPPNELLRNANARSAFEIPARSVMADAKLSRGPVSGHWRFVPVIGRQQGRVDQERRRSIERGGI